MLKYDLQPLLLLWVLGMSPVAGADGTPVETALAISSWPWMLIFAGSNSPVYRSFLLGASLDKMLGDWISRIFQTL